MRSCRFTFIASCLLLAACGGDSGPKVASVRITPAQVELDALGATAQLTATAYDKDGDVVPDVEFTWLTTHATVAPVSETGIVTAQANGVTSVSVRASSGHGATVRAVVQQVPASVQITPDSWDTEEAWIGARRQFSASVADANGHAIEGATVSWSSAATNLVHVDSTGLATIMGANGTANTQVIAQAGAATGEISFMPRYNDADTPGYMYTAWYARTDDTPAMLVDGRLVLPKRFGCTDTPETVCTTEFYGDTGWVNGFRPIWPHAAIEKFQYEHNRLALLTDMANGAGTLRIFDRASEMFIAALGNAVDFQLENNRVGMLLEGGMLKVMDSTSAATATWHTQINSGVVKFKLVGSFIGVLLDDGTVRVRAGLNGQWYQIGGADNVDFDLLGVQAVNEMRVAILRRDGLLRAKDGLDTSGLTDLESNVANFRLSANYIVATLTTGEFEAKEGLHGGWITLEEVPLRQYELSGERIATLTEDGRFRAKNGIHGTWRVLAASGARAIHLQDGDVGYVDDAGILRVRTGIEPNAPPGPEFVWLASQPQGAGVTQFRLIVDNPVAPRRTTHETYEQGNFRCRGVNLNHNSDPVANPNDCYLRVDLGLHVPYYGVFCGGGRPEHTGKAFGVGSINAFDEACVHHDTVTLWYPQWWHYVIFDLGYSDTHDLTGSCIVRYSIRHSRLTRDGVLLVDGFAEKAPWDAAWAGADMHNLWEAIDNYWNYTFSCSDENLGLFDVMTDAEHD